jgi:hypothetical protein
MIKEIPTSDIVTRPIKVYKEWTLDENDIKPVFGENPNNTLIDIDSDAKTYDINGFGFVKKIIYESTKAQFYTNPATASVLTEVGLRKSYASTDERVLENEMALFSIPQRYYGEGIKIGTVVLEDETLSRTYTDDGYSNLLDSGSNIKGNIFYDRGLVVVTKDVVSGSVLNQFTLSYRSTKTIYENEIFISVLENEFNVSQNPSAVDFNGSGFGKIKLTSITSSINPTVTGGFADFEYSSSIDRTGSFLAPYITTIGLYDNDLNMVAVAKLPQPIKSLPDYPVNFIIRFDT